MKQTKKCMTANTLLRSRSGAVNLLVPLHLLTTSQAGLQTIFSLCCSFHLLKTIPTIPIVLAWEHYCRTIVTGTFAASGSLILRHLVIIPHISIRKGNVFPFAFPFLPWSCCGRPFNTCSSPGGAPWSRGRRLLLFITLHYFLLILWSRRPPPFTRYLHCCNK